MKDSKFLSCSDSGEAKSEFFCTLISELKEVALLVSEESKERLSRTWELLKSKYGDKRRKKENHPSREGQKELKVNHFLRVSRIALHLLKNDRGEKFSILNDKKELLVLACFLHDIVEDDYWGKEEFNNFFEDYAQREDLWQVIKLLTYLKTSSIEEYCKNIENPNIEGENSELIKLVAQLVKFADILQNRESEGSSKQLDKKDYCYASLLRQINESLCDPDCWPRDVYEMIRIHNPDFLVKLLSPISRQTKGIVEALTNILDGREQDYKARVKTAMGSIF